VETKRDPRLAFIADIHGHAKGEHKAFAEERPIPYTARMLFLWFFHACRRSSPRFLMVADHMNYLTFEDPAAVNLVRRALKLAQAGDLYGAAETAGVELGHAAVVSEGLKRGMRYSIGAEIDNDPRCRPDAQNIVDAMKPDGMIRSIHFLPITHPQHGENWMWAFDNPEFSELYDVVGTANVWQIYMTTLLEAIATLPGNIVGHFYVPAKFGHWPDDAALEDYEDRFVAACAERGMAIELNSRYFYKYYRDDEAQLKRFRAAHVRLLRKAKAANVLIAVGSDAHSPKDQGNAFESVLEVLDEADINEIAFPIAGRLARVALRATEDVLRQHSAALAPPIVERLPTPKVDDTAETVPATAEPAAPAAAASAAAEPAASAPEAAGAEQPAAAEAQEAVAGATRARPRAKTRAGTAAATGAAPATDAEPAKAAVAEKRSLKKAATLAGVVTSVAAKAVAAVAQVLKPSTEPRGEAAVPPSKPPAKAKAAEAPAHKPVRPAPEPDRAPARVARPSRAPAPKTHPASKPAADRTRTRAAAAKAPGAKAAPARKATAGKPAPKPIRGKTGTKAAVKKSPGKAPARATAAKATAKTAPRKAKKAPAKTTAAKKPAAKATKRPSATKAASSKRSPAKKTVAKKSSRARR